MDGIGYCPTTPSLDDGRRRALKLLAGSSYGTSGRLAHGIHPAVLIGLFNAGLRRRASKRYPRVSEQSRSYASRSRLKGGKGIAAPPT
jgi:hypothetical protein